MRTFFLKRAMNLRHYFARGEVRLDNVIGRPEREAPIDVFFLPDVCEQDDRGVRNPLAPNRLENFKPVYRRKHHVEENDVVSARPYLFEALLSIRGRLNVETRLPQLQRIHFGDKRIVINDEGFHAIESVISK